MEQLFKIMDQFRDVQSRMENFFKSISEFAEPVPLTWWILVVLIAGLVIPTCFERLAAERSLNVQLLLTVLGFIIDFVFIYASVWILTYFHYRRFLKGRKGVNFFISKWFRFEQLTLILFFAFGILMAVESKNPITVLIGCCYGWTGLMGLLYFYEWLFRGRKKRQAKSFSLVDDDNGAYFFCEDRREHG